MADTLETRLIHAQAERLPPLEILSELVSDELLRRQDRLLARRIQQAGFRGAQKTLDVFDFDFNKKQNRQLVFDRATARFDERHEDALFLGPPGTDKSHPAQALDLCAIQQGHRVLYSETNRLLEELADAQITDDRKSYIETVSSVPRLILDHIGMRKLPQTAAEDLLEIVMRRYERASTLITSNRPSMSGENCSATLPPSPRSSTACFTTPTSCPADPKATEPNYTSTCQKRSPQDTPSQSLPPLQLAAFQVSNTGRFCGVD